MSEAATNTLGATEAEILQWENLAIGIALRMRPYDMDPEDAKQEARLVLVKCAPRFDRTKANFGTFGARCVVSHFWRLRERAERMPKMVHAAEEWEWHTVAAATVAPELPEESAGVEWMLAQLKPIERFVVSRIFGIGCMAAPGSVVGRELAVSKQRVNQILQAAMRRLRNRKSKA